LRDHFEHVPVDRIEILAAEVTVEPTQLRLVLFRSGLVRLLAAPPHDRLVPRMATTFGELVASPGLGSQPVLEFRRFRLAAGLSASSYSLSGGCREIDRPQKKSGEPHRLSRHAALDAWRQIFLALADSRSKDDQALAKRIAAFVEDMPIMRRTVAVQRGRERVPVERMRAPVRERIQPAPERARSGPEIGR